MRASTDSRGARIAVTAGKKAAGAQPDVAEGPLAFYFVDTPEDCAEPSAAEVDDVPEDASMEAVAATSFAAAGAGLVLADCADLARGADVGFGKAAGADLDIAIEAGLDAEVAGREAIRDSGLLGTVDCNFTDAGTDLAAGFGADADFAASCLASRHKAIPPSSPSSLLIIRTPAGSLKVTNRLLPPPIYNRS